ncbi:hypothetical protein GJ744_008714 [Endocarpon pusillum]|uniref:Uncharacterized protein n=1 Tax=Endocarpon pusillum TaxID=364733 RepID=A0A8H7AKW3_9EURO|nr:hypothetical protein GJ744_008714 [Endocarpon pusillum]
MVRFSKKTKEEAYEKLRRYSGKEDAYRDRRGLLCGCHFPVPQSLAIPLYLTCTELWCKDRKTLLGCSKETSALVDSSFRPSPAGFVGSSTSVFDGKIPAQPTSSTPSVSESEAGTAP